MAFIRVGEVIAHKRLYRSPKARVVDAMTIISDWPAVIKAVNCVEKFERTRAVAFKNGQLTIVAASGAVANELKMCEEQILAAFERKFKQTLVRELVVRRH